MSSAVANPLFDPLQGDVDTPTPSLFIGSHGRDAAPDNVRANSGTSSSVVSQESASSSAERASSAYEHHELGSTRAAGADEAGPSSAGRRVSPATSSHNRRLSTVLPNDDLFGDKRVSRVFGALDRSSLFGAEEEDDGARSTQTSQRTHLEADARAATRSSRYGGLLDWTDTPTLTAPERSFSQTATSSRAHTPLPDRLDEGEATEPSLNLLTTLHRMQDNDIERYMRMFSRPSRSSSASRDTSSTPLRSRATGRRNDPDGAPSSASGSQLEIPEVSTPSEESSLHAPPSSADFLDSSRSPSASGFSMHSDETRQDNSFERPRVPSTPYNLVRHLSTALSTALQSASDANAELEALLDEHERQLDNKRREWEAREAALRALCSLHGIKNGEIDRALMRASPLQQELEGRKTARVSPAATTVTPVLGASGVLSPKVTAPSSTSLPKAQESPAETHTDSLLVGGLSALHESLQEAMLDDLERSPNTISPGQMEVGASTRPTSPALSTNWHRRSSSKSTVITSRTRDTSPGAASARSARSQRPLSVSSIPTSEGTSVSKASAPPTSNKATGAAASAAAHFSRAFWRTKKSPAGSASSSLNVASTDKVTQPNVTRLPSIFTFGSSATTSAQQSPQIQANTLKEAPDAPKSSERSGPKTVELDFILPSDAKPPTFASLNRRESVADKVRPPAPQRRRRRANRSTADGSEESSGDEFEVYGGKGSLVPPRPVFSEIGSDILTPQLLTDRYGFVYDATPADIKLLREARKASSSAPACLTGIRVGMRARGMDDSDDEGTETDHDDGEEGEDDEADDHEDGIVAEPLSDDDLETDDTDDAEADEEVYSKGDRTLMAAGASTISVKTAAAPAMLTLDLPPSLDFTGLDTFASGGDQGALNRHVKAAGLTPVSEAKPSIEASVILAESTETGRLGPTSPSQEFEFKRNGTTTAMRLTPEPEEKGDTVAKPSSEKPKAPTRSPPTGSQTVRRLLSQLQSMHDEQQAEQQGEWDAFLKRRRERQLAAATASSAQVASKSSNRISRVFGTVTPALASSPAPSGDADEEELILGLVGIQRLGETKAGKEDWAELQRLCRRGIPLCYRGSIWKECSGATEMAEPGRYEELLGEHEGETNDCLTQIDLDVHRTMPTNIFFGGNGPGVPKLRRVLVAFSWYDPVCGYCQGMNNLAATLLLTLPSEEDAFWTLACIITKILPAEYYTSHLLVSQADQRVLVELVDEQIPKLAEHMREIGVDLPAVTFAWFLSLYTDCLPVETLFRVWDILFIDGMVVLFRISMAILLLSEKDLLATSGPAAFYGHMHSLTSRMFSVDRLMKLACEDLVHTIKYPNILTRREKHVQDLRSELGLDSA